MNEPNAHCTQLELFTNKWDFPQITYLEKTIILPQTYGHPLLQVNQRSEITPLLLQAWCQLLQQCFKLSDGHPEVGSEAAVVQFKHLNPAAELTKFSSLYIGCTHVISFLFFLLSRSTRSLSLDVDSIFFAWCEVFFRTLIIYLQNRIALDVNRQARQNSPCRLFAVGVWFVIKLQLTYEVSGLCNHAGSN